MKILITGGLGFIGSHIVDRCLKDGHEVTILDNFRHNTVPLETYSETTNLIDGSITDWRTVKQAMRDVSIVFHEAAQTNISHSILNPELTNEVNVRGTLTLLKAARQFHVKRFIYASSSSIYGIQEPPMTERMVPRPESPYAVSKLAGEYYCQSYYRTCGLPTVSLRYFNVFGSRQAVEADGTVIPLFLNALEEKKPFTIHGDGKQSRDFVHVRDVVEANILVATKNAAVGECFNIGCGKATSILELSEMLRRFGSSSSPLPVYGAVRKGDVKHSIADISKARMFLGYNPTTSLESDLKRLLEAE